MKHKRIASWEYFLRLTPALSLGERENSSQSVAKPDDARMLKRQTVLSPLLGGEGQGEGEGGTMFGGKQFHLKLVEVWG
jgi:hypothetical protein